MEIDRRRRCGAMHLGLWVIDFPWFFSAMNAVRSGIWQADQPIIVTPTEPAKTERKPYKLDPSGILTIDVTDQLTKGESSFGGTSTIYLRRLIRAAAADPDVNGLMLMIDSPGGTVDGIYELANDLRQFAELKPLAAHIDDFGASGAYWLASQADYISAGPTSPVGSIGTMSYLLDESGAFEKAGLKAFVVSTGARKGDLAPGLPITEPQLAKVQELVSVTNEFFIRAVAAGREVTPKTVREEWGTGEVWMAETAKAMGLIDGVSTMDEAMDRLRSKVAKRRKPGTRSAIAGAAIDLANS